MGGLKASGGLMVARARTTEPETACTEPKTMTLTVPNDLEKYRSARRLAADPW